MYGGKLSLQRLSHGGWLVGWFYRRPHTSYSLLGVVQLPTDVRIHGDTHSSVLRVFREYFFIICHQTTMCNVAIWYHPRAMLIFCAMSARYLVCSLQHCE